MTPPLLVAAWAGGALLLIGAVASVYRIMKGPSLLDRVVATDVLLVVLSSALVLDMAVRDHTDTVILVLLAAAVGFLGSVTVARFVEDRRPDHPQEENALMPGTSDVPTREEA